MTMNKVRGDLLALALDGRFDVIVHGCNCHCQMGAGIALSIRQQFPEAYEADRQTEAGQRAKLGTFSHARIVRPSHTFTVVNAYTQFHWRGRGVLADYAAIGKAMSAVGNAFSGLRIGYPRIGAGLAKGDWAVIEGLINAALEGQDHTLVELPE